MVEVKADALEESFEQFEDDGIAALKAELEVLKAKIASGAIQGQRPALDAMTRWPQAPIWPCSEVRSFSLAMQCPWVKAASG